MFYVSNYVYISIAVYVCISIAVCVAINVCIHITVNVLIHNVMCDQVLPSLTFLIVVRDTLNREATAETEIPAASF